MLMAASLMSLLFRKNSLVLLLEIDTGGVDFVVEGKVKEEREAPMLMVASWTTLVSYLPLELR